MFDGIHHGLSYLLATSIELFYTNIGFDQYLSLPIIKLKLVANIDVIYNIWITKHHIPTDINYVRDAS